MSMALQVMLLVVAIVIAVAGIGIALALRMTRRQGDRRAQGATKASQAKLRGSAPAQVIPLAKARAAAAADLAMQAAAKPAVPTDPVDAHKAKLAALQAMLALGDAKAEESAKSGGSNFADTQPVGDAYASTQFTDNPPSEISLLNLDKAGAKRKRSGS